MGRFVLFVVGAAFLSAFVPLLFQSGSVVGIAVAVILAFFILPTIASAILGRVLGSGLGTLLAFGVLFLALSNQSACANAGLPFPAGEAGDVINLANVGYMARSEYDECLDSYIRDESGNAALRTAAAQCEVQATKSVRACLPTVQEHWWRLDKEGYCRDQAAGADWRPCAVRALQSHSDNSSVALTACASRSTWTGVMRRVAGLVSNQSDPAQQAQQAPANASYDTGCLVKAFNDHLSYFQKDLDCKQFTGTQFVEGQEARPIITDVAKYHECIVQTLTINMGDTGRQLAQRCEVQR